VTEPEDQSTDSPLAEHGRIGYGRYAKYSPLGLALLLVIILLAIGISQRGPEESNDQVGQLVGKPAPDFILTLLDGSTLRLSNLRGSAVAVNFWAYWCDPCKNELPRLQTISEEASQNGQPLVVVGVGDKKDYDKNAREFVASLGLTYPIGRDTGGSDERTGEIQHLLGVTNYPTTIFIRADGIVEAVHIGELSEDQLREYVAQSVA
jgi:cytochrome c biogenesis protein CcmG, thiol:disulfide interchange protein DsbE